MPSFTTLVYITFALVGVGISVHRRIKRGRFIVKVWEKPEPATLAMRLGLSAIGFRGQGTINWWGIRETGISLPREYGLAFVKWADLEHVEWQGTRLILDTGEPMFSRESGLYELDVPADQCAEVAGAIAQHYSPSK